MTLNRNTPMPRGEGPKRKARLKQGSPLKRGEGLARAASKPQARRDTGPSARTRKAVYERDGWSCACCGTPVVTRPHSVGHRKRRSQGGSNNMDNLLTFLGLGVNPLDPGDHHARIDSRRDPSDEARGLTVRSWKDPALVPVRLFSPDGPEMWALADGTYSAVPPEGAVAA